ncbi:hypothetical protein E4U42_005963 [Claviceps africana]|uniref:GPI anchored protein n=1 Tax=Claviceps africana TaxID=83212 RepID=A0A8K0J3K2_9HYPO|nr:hypothetical protein E4U42_005963 [Claviceps africana]
MLLLAILAFATSAVSAAQPTPTLQLLFLGDKNPMVASVVADTAAAVTLAVQCPPGTASEDCGLPPEGVTITQGPKTWGLSLVVPAETGTISMCQNCKLDPAAADATCTVVSSSGIYSASSQAVLSDYTQMMYPVIITAGAEKLTATSGATATAVSAASSSPSSSPSSSSPATATATATNAARLMVTQSGVVLAGVAGVVAGVLAL